VELRQKGTDLHAATVVGDTVGDPFKDTSSVALNPVIKFTTLFGLLAVEIAVTMHSQNLKNVIGGILFIIALIFVHRSFYAMRVPEARHETSSSARVEAEQINGSHRTQTSATKPHRQPRSEPPDSPLKELSL
jgi:hypothetical protein